MGVLTMDMAAIAGLVSSLKAASDITQAVVGLRDTQMIQSKVIELQTVILSAQSSALSAQQDQFTLIDRIRSLEKKVADSEAWGAEAEQYELKQIDSNAFAYMKKPEAQGTEPPHWLCVNCFDNHRRRSILQFRESTPDKRRSIHACPHCKATIAVYYGRKPGDPYPPLKAE